MTASGFLMMLFLVPAGLGAAAYFALTAWRKRFVGRLAFRPRTFLTRNEVEFYHRLHQACAGQFVVMAQVSMAALIDTDLKASHSLYWEVRSKYSGRICDYVLCDPKTLIPCLVVELDDKMHNFGKDAQRDGFLARAGLKTVRFWSRNKPQPAEIRKILAESYSPRTS